MEYLESPIIRLLLTILIGTAGGLVNTFAGAGSAISLPFLIMIGLPAADANATNRLSVFLGSLMATKKFHTLGKINWPVAFKISIPALFGSAIGAYLVTLLPDRAIGIAVTIAVLITLVMILTKIKKVLFRSETKKPRVSKWGLFNLFLIGLWLGFLVIDGATYLLLIFMLQFHYKLAEANAFKVFLISVTAVIPLILFGVANEIKWVEGLILSAGGILGCYYGAKLSNYPNAQHWVFYIFMAVIILEIIHLAIQYNIT